jgi:hypothetical protein
MTTHTFRGAALALALAVSACSASNSSVAGGTAAIPLAPSAMRGTDAITLFRERAALHPATYRAVCPWIPRPGEARCFALMRTDIGAASPHGYRGRYLAPEFLKECESGLFFCYEPKDLWSAYNLKKWTKHGEGVRVGIVDFMDDPHAESDLATYRDKFHLGACTTANGCFRKVSQTGSATHLPPRTKDTGETSLDLQMVSAICPRCKIVLVETKTSKFRDIDVAEDEAVRQGAKIISNSFGGPQMERSDPAWSHHGIVQVASAGDWGYQNCASGEGCSGPNQPAAFSTVVAVGGTTLVPPGYVSGATGWFEAAWNCFDDESGFSDPRACDISTIFATGSGCSALTPKPAWQTDGGCTFRSYNDVAAVADLLTGVIVYDTNSGGWTVFGGTSVASPIISGVFALAGNGATRHSAKEIWDGRGAHLNNVVEGTDVIPGTETCPADQAYICNAGNGYNGPTGWGTPNGIDAF